MGGIFDQNLVGQDPWQRRGDSQAAIAAATIPVGVINAYYGTTAPSGWLICNGSSFSASSYPALAALLGGTTLPNLKGKVVVGFDAAETEFDTLGETGGAKTTTIASGNLPTHTHGLNSHDHMGSTQAENSHVHGFTSDSQIGTHTHSYAADDNTGGNVALNATAPTSNYAFLSHTLNTGSDSTPHQHSGTSNAGTVHSHPLFGDSGNTTNGGFANTAVSTLPPYMALNYIIKAA